MSPHYQKMFVWPYRICCWISCPIPQVTQMEICPWLFSTFERFLESWLDFPRSAGCHAMPLDYERPIIGNVFFPSEVILSTERIFVHWIFVVWISLSFEQLTIFKQCHLKNAKLMSVLKFFENAFFVVKQNLQECDINSRFIANLTGVRIPL